MSRVELILYFTFLVIFNVYWFMTYVLVIRRGFMEKTWGIPMISLTLNLAWDVSGSGYINWLLPAGFDFASPFMQKIANTGFMICNLIITYQMFRYWRSDFDRGSDGGKRSDVNRLSNVEFFWLWGMAQVASFFIIVIGSQELNDPLLVEMGYVDNFINSALFIAMLYRREGLQGQSIYIGLSKMIGTLGVSGMWLLFPWPGTTEGTWIMPFLIVGITLLDLTYVVGVYNRAKKMGIDVWRRW